MKVLVAARYALCMAWLLPLATPTLGQDAAMRLEQALTLAVTKACGAPSMAAPDTVATADATRQSMDCTIGVITYLRTEAGRACRPASKRDTTSQAQRLGRCMERAMLRAARKPIPFSTFELARKAQTDQTARLLLKDKATVPADYTVSVIGRQFTWTFQYMIGSKRCTLQKVLVLPYGKRTRLSVTAEDVIHDLSVPDLGIKIDAIPGRLNIFDIAGAALGRYSGGTSIVSGTGWRDMTIEVEVKSAEAYAMWERELAQSETCKDSP
jgi:heme/copper-type cytochrome/quinol oxidase subunit 2